MMKNSFFKKRPAFARRGGMAGDWLIVLTVSFFFLSACNSNLNSQDQEVENNVNHETTVFNNDVVKMQRNNGVKWKGDSATAANVRVLQNIVAQNVSPDINGYYQQGTQLQEGIDKLIKECRMSGPDHDALHQWLEPLMEDVRRLQQAESAEHALEIHGRIKSQIESYVDLFE